MKIAPGSGWVARGDTSNIQSPDGVTHVTGTLDLHADGTPGTLRMVHDGHKESFGHNLDFSGPMATIKLHLDGKTACSRTKAVHIPILRKIAILDNNLYSQYVVLADLYDWDKKGAQTFSVLVPQELTPGSVTVESAGSQNVDGKRLEELTVKTEDLEVDLYLDGKRLVRIAAPSTNAETIRD